MEYFARHPLEVFFVDENMSRASGSIPYTSLVWHRRYYAAGEYKIYIPADLYDQRWFAIVCWDRPEVGYINKVEYDDTALTPDGRDQIAISGFFLEYMFRDVQFLVEKTEEKEVEIPMPQNPNRGFSGGRTPYEIGYSEEAGEYVWRGGGFSSDNWWDSEGKIVDVDDVEPVDYEYKGKPHPGAIELPDGSKATGYYRDNKGYYTDNNGETVKSISWNLAGGGDDDEQSSEYDVLMKIGNTSYLINKNGTPYYVNGVCQQETSGWAIRFKKWLHGPRTKIVQVQGPWQRTEVGKPEKKGDVVQLLTEWVQYFYESAFVYPDPTITGPEKVLDISLKELYDVLWGTLKEMECSYRVLYDFEANTTSFEIWQGDDLTQDASGTPSVLPDGYVELEYIEATGTQWIDTGFTPNQDTRVVMVGAPMVDAPSYPQVAGYMLGIGSIQSGTFDAYMASNRWSTIYGTAFFDGNQKSGVGERVTIDLNKNVHTVTTDGGIVVYSHTFDYTAFTCAAPLKMFLIDRDVSGGYRGNCRAESLKIYDNGTKVRDMVPARRTSDGVIGMYDTVGGQFYGNDGSGAFVAGPDVPTSGSSDVPRRWAVFNDTWGSMHGYSASRDDSAYKNRCYVLHDYEVPNGWDDQGRPYVESYWSWEKPENATEGWYRRYRIPYHEERGYDTLDVGDDSDERKETVLDRREDKPSCDRDWPRDEGYGSLSEVYAACTEPEKLKGKYEAWEQSLKDSGTQHLVDNCSVIYNLDTGTLNLDGYIRDYDLGDKVDWYVERLGIGKGARITEVEEVYESGSITIRLTIDGELLTLSDKIRRSLNG